MNEPPNPARWSRQRARVYREVALKLSAHVDRGTGYLPISGIPNPRQILRAKMFGILGVAGDGLNGAVSWIRPQ